MIEAARRAKRRVLVDPKKDDWSRYSGAHVVTPNRKELAVLAAAEGRRIGRSGPVRADPVEAARTLLARNAEGEGAGAVLVSLGPAGAVLLRRDAEPLEIPAPRGLLDLRPDGLDLRASPASSGVRNLQMKIAARVHPDVRLAPVARPRPEVVPRLHRPVVAGEAESGGLGANCGKQEGCGEENDLGVASHLERSVGVGRLGVNRSCVRPSYLELGAVACAGSNWGREM